MAPAAPHLEKYSFVLVPKKPSLILMLSFSQGGTHGRQVVHPAGSGAPLGRGHLRLQRPRVGHLRHGRRHGRGVLLRALPDQQRRGQRVHHERLEVKRDFFECFETFSPSTGNLKLYNLVIYC